MSLSVPQDQPPRSGDRVNSSPGAFPRKPSGRKARRHNRKPSLLEAMETRVLMDGVNFLAPPVNYSLPGQDAFPVVVADVKGDGVPDIITATQAHYLSVTAGSQFGRVFDLAGNGN